MNYCNRFQKLNDKISFMYFNVTVKHKNEICSCSGVLIGYIPFILLNMF